MSRSFTSAASVRTLQQLQVEHSISHVLDHRFEIEELDPELRFGFCGGELRRRQVHGMPAQPVVRWISSATYIPTHPRTPGGPNWRPQCGGTLSPPPTSPAKSSPSKSQQFDMHPPPLPPSPSHKAKHLRHDVTAQPRQGAHEPQQPVDGGKREGGR